jgi:hypothetical protein
MALTSNTARQLCTKAELALFTESLARNVKGFDARALRSRVARSRKLRDKYRQLANRQDREARGKQQPRRRQPSRGSAATRKKEQMFAESLTRFEKQLAKLEAASGKTAGEGAGATRSAEKSSRAAVTRRKVTATEKKTSKRKTSVAKGATSRPHLSKASAKKMDQMSRAQKKPAATAKEARIIASGQKRKQKHLSALNRRQQARRNAS